MIELVYMIVPTICIATVTFFHGMERGEKKAYQRELNKQRIFAEAPVVPAEDSEIKYNQSYGQPDIVDYFDQEFIRKGVKQ